MPRPQFSLRTIFWLTLVVAAFFAGVSWPRHHEVPPTIDRGRMIGGLGGVVHIETLTLADGTKWFRAVYEGQPTGGVTFFDENGTEITAQPRNRTADGWNHYRQPDERARSIGTLPENSAPTSR